jgi:hypothetical protein
LFFLLLALGDFSQRMLIETFREVRSNSGEELELGAPGSQMPSHLYLAYQEKLAQFRPPKKILTDDLTLIAKSLKDSQYDWTGSVSSYKLLGIFTQKDSVAALARIDNKSLSRDMLKVRVGDRVEGFDVIEISAHELKMLGAGEKSVTLTLFAPSPPK